MTNLSYRYDLFFCHSFSLWHIYIYGDFFTFQQDSAPTYRACKTVALLSAETPDFISSLDWLPNRLCDLEHSAGTSLPLPDLWLRISERTIRLIEEWRRFDQNIIDRVVNQWRDRLHKRVHSARDRGTLRTSDMNILTVLTDINCAGNLWWLVGNVIHTFIFQ